MCKCGKNNCCCEKTVVRTGPRGKQGLRGKPGLKGDDGAPGTSQTETNLRSENAGYTPVINQANSPFDDIELPITVVTTGKYIVAYSGNALIHGNGGAGGNCSVYIKINASVHDSKFIGYNMPGTTGNDAYFSVDFFDTIDLTAGDVINIAYDFALVPVNPVIANFRGKLNLIKIA